MLIGKCRLIVVRLLSLVVGEEWLNDERPSTNISSRLRERMPTTRILLEENIWLRDVNFSTPSP